ncbi:type VI secretion system accessory protein TagJ [Paracidobacterium acidisoli]|uniref:Virulence protein SciE type n=1 Tax=Paracidobacterium acidisoli TaxID=2303751 RepID=A0A372IQZ1_9BACT|nr:type VI secretion system accessory protein TagJ [Paracidobacterium acidisoli]MBT9330201.1 virulence protein SciE type [Paracidobacterium acidisoli]
MDALSLYRAGQLQPAIEALGVELRKQPLDVRRRTFLFELLCFAGEYERAGKQLDILSDSGKEAAAGSMLYRAALHAETTRQAMFAENKLPVGSALASPSGQWNHREFTSLTDGDLRIGSHLEVFIAGSYTWIPLAYIESLEIQPPKRLRDTLWIPAILHTTSDFRLQDLGEVLLPALAPLSWRHADDMVRLGHKTVWEENAEYGAIPHGQKVLLSDEEEESILELRSLTFHHARETAESAIT